MTVALSRIRQGGLEIEGTSGTAETLVAADFERNLSGLNFVASATRYSRGILRAALTKLKDLVGGKIGEITWTEELTGGSVSSDAPWYDSLLVCGFQKATLKGLIVTGVTGGSFAAGDTIDSGAGETGRVAWTGTIGSDIWIVYQPIAGTIDDTDTISNGTASGTVSGAPVDAGFTFRPMSENGSQTPPTGTAEYHDPNYTERLVGAAGDATIMFKWGEVPKMDLRLRGPRQIKDVDGTPLDPGLVANVSAAAAPTMVLGDIGLPLSLDSWQGVFTELTVKLNNTLTDRKTLSTAGVIGYVTQGYKCGYMPTRITDRRIEIALDPETPAEATKSLMKNWHANTDMRLHFQTGLLLALGQNALVINGPKVSLAQDSFQQTDRDGINTLGLTLLTTGATNDDDEIYFDHVYIPVT